MYMILLNLSELSRIITQVSLEYAILGELIFA